MKILIVLMLLCVSARSQTFVNYRVTEFTPTNFNGSHTTSFASSFEIDVPTNTLLKIVEITGNVNRTAFFKYPESESEIEFGTYVSSNYKMPTDFLGQVKIRFALDSGNTNGVFNLLASFETVNQTPDVRGLAVQPASKGASVQLQTSEDLKTWNEATNGTYPATNSAQFYRLNFQVQ